MQRLKNNNRILLMMFVTVGLTACGNFHYPHSKPPPALNFNYLTPYTIQNGGTRIGTEVQKTPETIAIEREIGFSPADITTRYLVNRFNVVAEPKKLLVEIEKADLTKETLQTGALEFMIGLTKDHYDLSLVVALYPLSKSGSQQEPYRLTLNQRLIMSENVSLGQRELKLFEWMEQAITKLDTAINDIVANNLNN